MIKSTTNDNFETWGISNLYNWKTCLSSRATEDVDKEWVPKVSSNWLLVRTCSDKWRILPKNRLKSEGHPNLPLTIFRMWTFREAFVKDFSAGHIMAKSTAAPPPPHTHSGQFCKKNLQHNFFKQKAINVRASFTVSITIFIWYHTILNIVSIIYRVMYAFLKSNSCT